MSDRMVEIQVGKFVKDEIVVGFKNFFMPIFAVASEIKQRLADNDPYDMAELKTAEGPSQEQRADCP